MKEYEILYKYTYQLEGNLEAPFDLVSQAIYGKTTNMINFEASKQKVNEVFDFLELKRKFDELTNSTKMNITYRQDGFHLDEFKFETISEIEHALKNKAFL